MSKVQQGIPRRKKRQSDLQIASPLDIGHSLLDIGYSVPHSVLPIGNSLLETVTLLPA